MATASKWAGLSVMVVLLFGCAGHYFHTDEDAVRIYLKAPRAECVELMASFNGYLPLPAERLRGGTWMVKVSHDDSFAYFYRIDGRVRLPDCEMQEQDDFGQSNCIFQKTP